MNLTDKTKVCRKCETERPIEGFNRLAKSKDGRRNQCRVCDRDYIRGRRSGEIQLSQETTDRRKEFEGPGANDENFVLLSDEETVELAASLIEDGFDDIAQRHSCGGRVYVEKLGKVTHHVCTGCSQGWEE